MEYGDVKEFEKYLKRYNIFEISYEKLEKQDYQFVSLFLNFTNNSSPELNVLLEENDEYLVENFKERFNKIFQNFLFLHNLLYHHIPYYNQIYVMLNYTSLCIQSPSYSYHHYLSIHIE